MIKYVTQEHFNEVMRRREIRFDQVNDTIQRLHDDTMTKLDGIVTILQRLDQDRLSTHARIGRIESDVTMVKKHLKLA
ncbi:MAG: hypothetical protein V1838_01815 [Patescibacteria group bacterium]